MNFSSKSQHPVRGSEPCAEASRLPSQMVRSGAARAVEGSPTASALEMMLAEMNDEVQFLRERCHHFEVSLRVDHKEREGG